MRKRKYEEIDTLLRQVDSTMTLQDKGEVESWYDPISLSQEIYRELHDLNSTAENIRTYIKWGLVLIGLILLYIAFK